MFSPGQPLTICPYCGYQVVLESSDLPPPPAPPPSAGATLATSIGIRVPSGQTFPLLTAGTSVPAQHSETLSTQRDDQESITIDLVNGSKDLVKVVFPLNARKPRGAVAVQLLLKVDGAGGLTFFVTEQGTTNTTKREVPVEIAR